MSKVVTVDLTPGQVEIIQAYLRDVLSTMEDIRGQDPHMKALVQGAYIRLEDAINRL